MACYKTKYFRVKSYIDKNYLELTICSVMVSMLTWSLGDWSRC